MTKDRGPRRVYFIKPIGMDGPIKIGCSIAPDNRRETLQSWCPFPLEVLAEIEGGYLLERRFHQAFIADHRGHEWFNTTPRLLATIDEIILGTFLTETLPKEGKRSDFRKTRDNSYLTDEWRYRSSFWARWRHLRQTDCRAFSTRLTEILGSDRHYGVNLLPHKAELEALLGEMRLTREAA